MNSYNSMAVSLGITGSNNLDAGGNIGGYNHWWRLGRDVSSSNAALYTVANSKDFHPPADGNYALGHGYNDSPFALKVEQGVGEGQRIGRDISVVSDDWYIKISFPPSYPGFGSQKLLTPARGYVPVDSNEDAFNRIEPDFAGSEGFAGSYAHEFRVGYPVPNHLNASERPIRVRLVCLFQDVLDSPGDIGFPCSELFESQYDIHSRFARDGATGYKILYDKTKTLYLNPALDYYDAPPTTIIDAVDQNQSRKGEVSFRMNAKYLRRYEPNTASDTSTTNSTGNEIVLTGLDVTGGVSRGALSWYIFVEDMYSSVSLNSDTPTFNSTNIHYTCPYMSMEVNRKTLWIDP